ncbi:hypothetical protein TNCV_3573591 [Trichonephila clavipes]|nr:hypothetical protein TNCV_3573591 [Trichonephila clavipes]
MAPWPRAPVIPQLVDRKTFRDNRWVRHLSLTSWTSSSLKHTCNIKHTLSYNEKHGKAPLNVKEDIEDVSSELDSGGGGGGG